MAGSQNEGYLRIRLEVEGRSRAVKAHRLAWFIVHGEPPVGVIDHINGDSMDNRAENLRDVSSSANRKNSKLQRNNRSGVNGVSWVKRFSKWVAFAHINGKTKSLGYFDDKAAAAEAARTFRSQHGYTDRHGAAL